MAIRTTFLTIDYHTHITLSTMYNVFELDISSPTSYPRMCALYSLLMHKILIMKIHRALVVKLIDKQRSMASKKLDATNIGSDLLLPFGQPYQLGYIYVVIH